MKKTVAARSLAAGTAMALLAGCGGGAGSQEPRDATAMVKGGSAVISLAADIDSLDPVKAAQAPSRQVLTAICDGLYATEPDGTIVPGLATGMPDISADGRVMTIALREQVVFNDGTIFNAQAVKAHLDRAINEPDSLRTVAKQVITSVNVIDDHTVEVALNAPYSPLLAELADFLGMVPSPTQMQAKGAEFSAAPVCVGAFEYESRSPGQDVVVSKSDKYYGKEAVNLDEVIFPVVPDVNVRATNIETGSLDFGYLDPTSFPRLQASAGLFAEQLPGNSIRGVRFNIGNASGATAPVGEVDNVMAEHPELREAFALAVDSEALRQTMSGGAAEVGCTPFAPSSPFALDLECPVSDLAKAKELVAQSGVQTPIRLEFKVPNWAELVKEAEVIQAMVKQVGFDLEIVTGEGLAIYNDGINGDFEVMLHTHVPTSVDPSSLMTPYMTGQPNNTMGFSDPEVDELLSAANRTSVTNERKALFQQAAGPIHDSYAFVITGFEVRSYATPVELIIPKVYPDYRVDVKTAGFTSLPS